MSAFVVSKKHIDAMISSMAASDGIYWEDKRLSFFGDHDRLGQELVNQNYRSVNERYNEEDAPPVYHLSGYVQMKPIEIIKACHCYNYQACETEDYKETLAHRIVEYIEYKNIRKLPGYEDAKWEIT